MNVHAFLLLVSVSFSIVAFSALVGLLLAWLQEKPKLRSAGRGALVGVALAIVVLIWLSMYCAFC
jgi:hypothetical protein